MAEIAFSLVLLIGSALMVKSLAALVDRNPGFDTQRLLVFVVNLPSTSYPKDPDAIRFDKEFTDRLRNLPGVEGVTSNSVAPLTGGGASIRFLIEGRPVAMGHENECNIRDVGSNYFSVMKIPLLDPTSLILHSFSTRPITKQRRSTSSSTQLGQSSISTARIPSASASNSLTHPRSPTAKSSASSATLPRLASTAPMSQVSSCPSRRTRTPLSPTWSAPAAIPPMRQAPYAPHCMLWIRNWL